MLTEYIRAAMRRAEYEDLGPEGWFGHIPGLPGVWANAPTREATSQELQSVLEDWMLLSLRLGDPLPIVDGIDLNVPDVA